MGKPHKHAEVIKAWADGATIQLKRSIGDWVDVPEPEWVEHLEYRVAAREFEAGKWYPVIDNDGDHTVRLFNGKEFLLYGGAPKGDSPKECHWIGDALIASFPDETFQ